MINISFRTWFEEFEEPDDQIRNSLIKAVREMISTIESDEDALDYDLGHLDEEDLRELARKANHKDIASDQLNAKCKVAKTKNYKVKQLAELLSREDSEELRDEKPTTYPPKTPTPKQPIQPAPQAPMSQPSPTSIPGGMSGNPVVPPQM